MSDQPHIPMTSEESELVNAFRSGDKARFDRASATLWQAIPKDTPLLDVTTLADLTAEELEKIRDVRRGKTVIAAALPAKIFEKPDNPPYEPRPRHDAKTIFEAHIDDELDSAEVLAFQVIARLALEGFLSRTVLSKAHGAGLSDLYPAIDRAIREALPRLSIYDFQCIHDGKPID